MLITALAPHRRERTVIATLSGLSFVATFLEAAALGLVAPTALAIASGEQRVTQALGPVDIDMSVRGGIGAAAVLLLGSALFQLLQSWSRARIISAFEAEKRLELIDAYLETRWEMQAQIPDGRLVEVHRNISLAAAGLGSLSETTKAATSLVVLGLMAAAIDWQAAVGMISIAILIGAFLFPVSRRIRAVNARLAHVNVAISEDISELQRTSREAAIFDSRSHYMRQAVGLTEVWRRQRLRAALLNNFSQPIYQLLGILAVLLGMLLLSLRDGSDASTASASALILLRSIGYGQNFQHQLQLSYSHVPYAELAEESISDLHRSKRSIGTVRAETVRRIELVDITYRYDGSDREALQGISLRLEWPEVIGVVGPSGGGKSTLAQVLLQLRSPTTGSVIVDGLAAEEIAPDVWARAVGYVPQHSILLRASLRDNVSAFRPGIRDEHVVMALDAAGLGSLVDTFPRGLETTLGPGGRDLSGGQLQRLGIARALAGQPGFIVFDEPTSALDLETEAKIQDTLAHLRGTVTLVIIAHRLSTLGMCDRLIVVENGRISFDGSRDVAIEESSFMRAAVKLGSLPD